MVKITYIEHDGRTFEVDAEIGSTVMQTAVDNGIEGIVAECGGACSCATCHCYIDEAWVETVGEANQLEQQMLGFTVEPRDNSRLGCQIDITQELDGLVVRLPEAQF
ncbi:2Fe-2S iron-sulfur cluster-binding protein [Parahaliea aestuarii]|uniref:2Fe-2S iron-sulfur cluster binding domain-containing protein n=1 Tax=Parahaliea aestuarii TaxID=1852021 RepID=A0A5C9A5P6_9GAMM|nr:2Fe-2S iron-sulfur cluster-binding protein [Parahaliea aestuarii]TXS95080.1 2Fe-2S iron-sulfur cluster binding domain-containing protein [Parahaliea aestuarii]